VPSSSLWERFYADFLLPDRLQEYRQLLVRAAELGYRAMSIGEYRRAVAAHEHRSTLAAQERQCAVALQEHRPALAAPEQNGTKVLILRHDIDTDVPTAKLQFEIERSLGVSASYFFRLATVDVEFMRHLHACGSDVGYHYEELSTVAREQRLRTRGEVELHLPEIRERFRENLRELRAIADLPLRFVAAHGDMANRHLGMRNQELLDDALLSELQIEVTADARAATPGLVSRFSDTVYPNFWKPHDPKIALERGDAVLYLLTHPRQWRRNVRENLRDDLGRLVEGYRYRRGAKRR
jgi:hypothetical protein